jgi:hypothetical protein
MIMKRHTIFNGAFIICLIAALCSCSDYLDIKPRGDEVAKTLADYEGLLNSNSLMSLSYTRSTSGSSMTILASDIMAPYLSDEWTTDAAGLKQFGNGTAMSGGGYGGVQTYEYADSVFRSSDYSAAWGSIYSQLYIYNVVANGVMDASDGTTTEKLAVQAEARVMRAYMLFLAEQFFGQPYNAATASTDLSVPIVKTASTGETGFTRATVKELYDFCTSEMEDACPNLPDKAVHKLRTYKAAGYAMMGRVYWMMGDYANAMKALTIAKASLDSDTGVSFYNYNTMMTKWGFKPAAPERFASNSYPSLIYKNNETVYSKSYTMFYISFYFYSGSLYIKPDFYSLYGANDLRKYFFVSKSFRSGAVYPAMRPVRTAANIGISLPDIYLMLAECKARTGDLSSAKELLYDVRKNRMPAADATVPATVSTQNDLIRFIVDERKREFMGTGLRWLDMRRLWDDDLFQTDKAGYTHTDGTTTWTLTKKRLTLKLPPNVLQWNTGWSDNE